MKSRNFIFAGLVLCAIAPALAESLLRPMAFPKTFNDVGFNDKYAVLAEGYDAYDTVYDENGKCISGCPYAGITIQEMEKQAQTANQAAVVDLIQNHGYTFDAETETLHPTQSGFSGDAQPVQQTQPSFLDQFAWNSTQTAGGLVQPVQPIQPITNFTDNTGGYYPTAKCINNEYIRGDSSVPWGDPMGYKARITSKFGVRIHPVEKTKKFHNGIDLGVPVGSNVYATAHGVVTKVDQDKWNGKRIVVEHPSGYATIYVHLSEQLVQVNQRVASGCLIGKSGNTGVSTGPHLHYSVRKGQDYVDPGLFLGHK